MNIVIFVIFNEIAILKYIGRQLVRKYFCPINISQHKLPTLSSLKSSNTRHLSKI